MERLTTEIFKERAEKIHKGKYNYSKVQYKNSYTKVCIICSKHGEFWQTPHSHLNGHGCPLCNKQIVHKDFSNTEEFISKARKVHGDKYDYSKVEYKSAKEKVCIICPEHGEFWQTPNSHLNGSGCPRCKNKISSLSDFEIKDILNKKFGDVYENIVSIDKKNVRVYYNGYNFKIKKRTLLTSIKPITGPQEIDDEYFISKAKTIHTINYDYSKLNIKDLKVCIICPEHGEFYMSKYSFLSGQNCPKCHKSKLEERTSGFLTKRGIEYFEQYPMEKLVKNSNQVADFYIPKYKTIIECQGLQHFTGRGRIYTNDMVKKIICRDIIKYKKLTENGFNVLYFLDSHVNKEKIFNEKRFSGIYHNKNSFTSLKELILEMSSFNNIY